MAELGASELSRLRASKTTKFEGSAAADRPAMRAPLCFRAAGENRQLRRYFA